MSSLFTSTLALNFRRSGARAANTSSSPLTTASTCSSGARVPHPGQRSTGSLWMSETSMEKDSSHFWHWNSSCMTAASRPAQHSHGFPPWKGGMKISRRLSLTRRSARGPPLYARFRQYLVGIKGPLTTPVGGGIRSLNVALRQMLDLFVCLRPVRWFKGVPSPVKRPDKIDMVIFRENTEDIYAGIEYAAATPESQKVL